MKKIIISFALIIAIMVMPMQFAFAAGAIDYTAVYDVESDGFVVSGSVQTNKSNVLLRLIVTMEDGTFVTGDETVAVRNSNDEITFKFDEIKLPYTSVEGTYKFIVSGDGYTASEVQTLSYLPIEGKRQFLADINALIDGGGSGIYEKVSSKAVEFGLSSTDILALDEEAQDIFDESMLAYSYNVPEEPLSDPVDPADVAIVGEACTKYKADVDVALAIASLANIKNGDMVNAWFTKYYKALDFGKDDTSTTEDEAKIIEYLDDVQSTATFVKRISDFNAPTSIDQIKDHVYESILLSAVETMNHGTVYTIITSFPSLFSIDKNAFDKLSADQQSDIYKAVAKTYYATYKELVDDFDDKVANVDNGDDDYDDGPNGWGGGKTGHGKVGISADVIADSNNQESEATGFIDIAGVNWAKDAILYLANNGIINGKSEGIFAPNDFITRAEFVKLLVAAIGIDINSGEKTFFADVAGNEWYAPYVAAAKAQGLVFGNEEKMFEPESTITRQDMAVILYRAFKPQAEISPISFDDTLNISDYAREAVDALSAAEVINGTGNNMFSPLDGATRAHAAVMIYKLIK